MNKDFVINKWVPALRSGEYKQGKSTLRNEHDQFCCLGVAADILVKEDIGFEWGEDTGYHRKLAYKDVRESARLPQVALNHLDMTNFQQAQLIWENDLGKTFDEIADTLVSWVEGAEKAKREELGQALFTSFWNREGGYVPWEQLKQEQKNQYIEDALEVADTVVRQVSNHVTDIPGARLRVTTWWEGVKG